MAYLGRAVDSGAISNIQNLDNISFNGSSSYSLTKNSVAFVPASASNLLISIDGVVNATNFTVSGSTIDFGVAVSSSSVCNFIIHLGVGLVTSPSDNSVTTSKIQDANITTAKIANDAVTKDKLLSHNYPAFEAKLSGTFTLTEEVNTKVTFQTENFDTDNLYDNSTNYRFTPNVSGKYFVYSDLNCDTQQTNSFRQGTVWIYKNGAAVKQTELLFNTNFARRCNVGVSGIVEMNGSSDYLEIFVNVVNGIGSLAQLNHQSGLTNYFGAYRIGA